MAKNGKSSGSSPIPVIDLFAGPGGLGEGFSSVDRPDGRPAFKIHLSIEKDPVAHQTLQLRAFFRQFPRDRAPDAYYQFLRQEIGREELFDRHPEQAVAARAEAWNCELKRENAGQVRERITAALGGTRKWVLIGGPPCQAYSLVGRSRNAGIKGYDLAEDPRQKLYVDYLQVIADHAPAVFVMENVKGLLSAKVNDAWIFEKILADLQSPCDAIRSEGRVFANPPTNPRYRLHSLNPTCDRPLVGDFSPKDFLIRAERHGIPQARHRLIIVGVHEEIPLSPAAIKTSRELVTVRMALGDLPALRSGISGEPDCEEKWTAIMRSGLGRRWLKSASSTGDHGDLLAQRLIKEMISVNAPEAGRGGEFLAGKSEPAVHKEWFYDPRIGGVCNHSTRSHMKSDLHRYLFAACFASVEGRSPSLSDFPRDLLPDHDNVSEALATGHFSDRFRVQLADLPSTTITSHISKDGHYYIHYDPAQCRSLTVREAARLQTFPDNYFFCGGRTAQYSQVGNAVPPLLARQIAEVVYNLLSKRG